MKSKHEKYWGWSGSMNRFFPSLVCPANIVVCFCHWLFFFQIQYTYIHTYIYIYMYTYIYICSKGHVMSASHHEYSTCPEFTSCLVCNFIMFDLYSQDCLFNLKIYKDDLWMRHVCFSSTGIGYEMNLILIFPSGNQTWQWKIHHLSFMDDFPSQKPPFPVDFPLPCLITEG